MVVDGLKCKARQAAGFFMPVKEYGGSAEQQGIITDFFATYLFEHM